MHLQSLIYTRCGTILIMVAGLSAILASLSLAFLVRMRSDGEESVAIEREAQAHIMLMAGCTYVLEASRLGYDKNINTTNDHDEAFGWIDVRDGSVGPRDQTNAKVLLYDDTAVDAAGRPAWPRIDGITRCPMYVMERPRYPIRMNACYNPMATDDTNDDTFGMPFLANPDPLPMASGANNTDKWTMAQTIDDRPRGGGALQPWFRVYRESAAVFVITCGSGGTNGFSEWSEVQAFNQQNQFGNDSGLFDNLKGQESRLWYRVEWSAAVGASDYHLTDNRLQRDNDMYYNYPVNMSQCGFFDSRSEIRCPNLIGTIRWVQRLESSPPTNKW